jgi:hypothetical protein
MRNIDKFCFYYLEGLSDVLGVRGDHVVVCRWASDAFFCLMSQARSAIDTAWTDCSFLVCKILSN